MAATAKRSLKSATPARRRDLLEYVQGTGSPLEVDETAGVIKRVKVLGRFSRNHHNIREAENGTEYTPKCMREAVPLYEGVKVKCDHPADRSKPGAERPVEDIFGVLRNVRVESDDRGEPAVWADLHYLKTHPLAPRVVEDVRRGLGVYGLSHNAASPRDAERLDPANRRLVIESLALVRSVDLVDKPATNRNLWESQEPTPMTTTLRSILESQQERIGKKKAGPKRLAWLRLLLEDDMAGPMDAPMEAEGGGEPEDELWAGFQAAIMAILEKYAKGELDAKAATAAIGKYIKAHDNLSGEGEDVEEAEEDDEPDKGKEGKEKIESELTALRTEKAVRQLCESLEFAPTSLQVDALAGLPTEAKRRSLIESFKAAPAGKPGKFAPPRSAAPGKAPQQKPQATQIDAAADIALLRG